MRKDAWNIASQRIPLSPLDDTPQVYSIDELKLPVQTIRNAIYSTLSDKYAELDDLVLELLGDKKK
jgi:hypothetical protein